MDKRIRVQEGSKNSRSEGKNQRENSKGLVVGRRQRERERKEKTQNMRRHYLRSTLIYLHAKINLVPSFS